jgi:hypothetical protein
MMEGMDEGHPTFDSPLDPDEECDVHEWRIHYYQGHALWVECRRCKLTPKEVLDRQLVHRGISRLVIRG